MNPTTGRLVSAILTSPSPSSWRWPSVYGKPFLVQMHLRVGAQARGPAETTRRQRSQGHAAARPRRRRRRGAPSRAAGPGLSAPGPVPYQARAPPRRLNTGWTRGGEGGRLHPFLLLGGQCRPRKQRSQSTCVHPTPPSPDGRTALLRLLDACAPPDELRFCGRPAPVTWDSCKPRATYPGRTCPCTHTVTPTIDGMIRFSPCGPQATKLSGAAHTLP